MTHGPVVSHAPFAHKHAEGVAELALTGSAMLDWKVEASPRWADVRAEYGQCISFQQVEDYTPPDWPAQEQPQQMHLDVLVR